MRTSTTRGFGAFRPVVVNPYVPPAPVAVTGTRVTLTRSIGKRPKLFLHVLRPPVVTTAATVYFRREPATLAPSRGKRPRVLTYVLRDPVVVGASVISVVYDPISTSIAPSWSRPRKRAMFQLSAPIVVAPTFFQAPIMGYLTRPLDRVPPTMSVFLKAVGLEYPPNFGPRVKLVPLIGMREMSRRGTRHYLWPPTVVLP